MSRALDESLDRAIQRGFVFVLCWLCVFVGWMTADIKRELDKCRALEAQRAAWKAMVVPVPLPARKPNPIGELIDNLDNPTRERIF